MNWKQLTDCPVRDNTALQGEMIMDQKIKALQEKMEQRISQIDSKDKLAAFWQDFEGITLEN